MAVVPQTQDHGTAHPGALPRPDAPPRRVRHDVADGAAVVAFSLGTSVALALVLGLAVHVVR